MCHLFTYSSAYQFCHHIYVYTSYVYLLYIICCCNKWNFHPSIHFSIDSFNIYSRIQNRTSNAPPMTLCSSHSHPSSSESMFEFRTFDPEGLVFYGDTQDGWFVLGLRGGVPEMQMTEGDAISYTWGGPRLNDGQWHKVEVRSEGSFVKLEVDGSLALMVGLNSLGAPGRSHLRGQMRLSLGAMLIEQEKLYHPLVLPMDGCLAKGNWLNQRNLWETDTKLDAKLCLGNIRRGSHFSGRGLVVFNTSGEKESCDIKGLTGSLLNIQTQEVYTPYTHIDTDIHIDNDVVSVAPFLVQYGPKSVHFDLKHPQDWRSQWTEGLFLTFGGVPDPSYQRGSDYLLGCVRRIKVQDRDVDLDRALYKDNSISSHSCPHLTAK
uniref:Laminin G domain-containing protein n=1 Tax=Scleropages formosus TaxID=113540 RepID=A0A8C9UXG6_SCLFO